MIDERTEYLISRRLDGELDADDSLELDKRLIRSPEARQLFEEYARNDALAARALRAVVRAETLQVPTSSVPSARLGWAARAGIAFRAVAAVLLLGAMAGVPSYWQRPPAGPVSPAATELPEVIASAAGLNGSPSASPSAMESPREETQQLQRNVVGVWDEETQSVYVLELDQRGRKVVPLARNF